jgi:hypothetical protein
MGDASHREAYVLTLQPPPGVDPIRALQWVLKGLLRRYGLKCVDIREAEIVEKEEKIPVDTTAPPGA